MQLPRATPLSKDYAELQDDSELDRVDRDEEASIPLVPLGARNDYDEHDADSLDEDLKARSKNESHEEDPTLAMVKSVVKETDDPSLPNLTVRVVLLGSILCAIGAAISQLFFVRIIHFNHKELSSRTNTLRV